MSSLTKEGIFWEIHSGLPREGPGDNASTSKAFSMLTDLPDAPFILDIACGPGMQTMELARLCNGDIVALDTHQEFLDELDRRAVAAKVEDRVTTVNASMFELPFDEDSFDLIWCEGAIYILGFEEGLTQWRPLLKNKGYLAVTNACYLKSEIPDAVRKMWEGDYPGISTIENSLEAITRSGYKSLDHFILPSSAWMDNYYTPKEERIKTLRTKYIGNADALKELDESQSEVDMYRKYSDFYGYVFFVMQSAE